MGVINHEFPPFSNRKETSTTFVKEALRNKKRSGWKSTPLKSCFCTSCGRGILKDITSGEYERSSN